VRALQGPFIELQQQIVELNRKIDSLEGLHRQFAVDVEGQVKQVEANVAKEMHAIREAMKEVKELRSGQELLLTRLATLEQKHRVTAQHLQRTQKLLGKLTANVEGWQEHERAVDRHVEEIVIVEPHDDGRGPKQRR